MSTVKNIKPGILLFVIGFLGVISLIPTIPQLYASQTEPLPMSMLMIQIISTIQSSILLLLMVWLGAVFSKKVGLTSPVIFAISHSTGIYRELKPQLIPALLGGIASGMFVIAVATLFSDYLPSEFINAAANFTPPWYTKMLYAGITEELLIRWGLMSFLVWGIYQLTQKRATDIRPHNYILAIIISALIFGLAHLPAAFTLSSGEATIPLVVYIIVGNAAPGFITGYLYWKRGLECAMGAHMIAYLTMIIIASFAEYP